MFEILARLPWRQNAARFVAQAAGHTPVDPVDAVRAVREALARAPAPGALHTALTEAVVDDERDDPGAELGRGVAIYDDAAGPGDEVVFDWDAA